MFLNSFYQIIRFAWQSFWRNIWLSLATISIITLAFLSVNFLVALNVITGASLQYVQDKVDVSLYFKQSVAEPEVLETQTYLSSLAEVKDIEYISQDKALDEFRRKHQADPTILASLDSLDENPLGAVLVVKAKSLEGYPEIISVLDGSKYTSLIASKNFDDHKLYINKITQLSQTVNKIGFGAAGVFAFIALLIVVNTIRVAIYTHRQEIAVMKLVGATNWFIRSPFLAESILYGIVAALLALGITYPVLRFIQPYLDNFFLTNTFSITGYFQKHAWQILGLQLLAITALNVVSSGIALRRYLKV